MIDPETGETREVELGSPRRLKTIYSTNMRTARAAGQWERIQRTKATHPYLLYELGPSGEHRPEHVAWGRDAAEGRRSLVADALPSQRLGLQVPGAAGLAARGGALGRGDRPAGFEHRRVDQQAHGRDGAHPTAASTPAGTRTRAWSGSGC